MIFLPIVVRELRLAARRRSTYFLRSSAALAVIVLGTWVFLMMQREAPRQAATAVFGVLTGSAIFYCLLSGVQATSDCLSQEKREGTLGLLFLTDLKGYDVVLGKLAASSIHGLYAVLAVLPMLAIPLLIGGVAPGEFWRMALLALNTLFFSLTLGICTSALCVSARKAASATFLVILFFTVLMPLLGLWVSYASKRALTGSSLYLTSPGYAFSLAFDFTYRTGQSRFWTSMVAIHAIGWAALVLASLITPRIWQERPASSARLRLRQRLVQWSYGSAAERLAFRTRLLDANAFYWLAARARLKPAMVWGVLGLLGCGWVAGWVKYENDWLMGGMHVVTGLILIVLIKGWFASECGRQLADERQGGTLELLLSTPLSLRDILRGQTLALQRQFLGPASLVAALLVVLMVAGLPEQTSSSDRSQWLSIWLGSLVLLPADLAAMYWVGVWQGMTAKNPARAANGTLGRILVLPWVLFAGCMLFVALVSVRGGGDPHWGFLVTLWLFLGIGTDLGFGFAARHRVLTRFRQVATQPYRGPLSSLKDFFGAG